MNKATTDVFMQEYFASGVTGDTFFMGVPVLKCPLDLWVLQEIIWETKPTLVIETGTAYGGSALWMASILEQLGDGSVLSIDASLQVRLPMHRRIEYLERSSIDQTVTGILTVVDPRQGRRWMVILDSDHSKQHVLKELELYASLVTPGNYLIVEDTCISESIFPEKLPGPAEALAEWLPKHPEFEVDRSREKFGVTWNPGGYLRRQ